MGKNKELRAQISSCIDPRFMGSFQRKPDDSVEKDKTSKENKSDRKKMPEQPHDENKEFRSFLSRKLFEFIDSQYEEVELSDDSSELSDFEIEPVSLFYGLDEISGKQSTDSGDPPPKKKKKKEKDNIKEQIKEIAVTSDWVHQRAKLLNS